MNYPSRVCLNFLHAAWKHAGYFLLQNIERRDPAWKHFVEYDAASTI